MIAFRQRTTFFQNRSISNICDSFVVYIYNCDYLRMSGSDDDQVIITAEQCDAIEAFFAHTEWPFQCSTHSDNQDLDQTADLVDRVVPGFVIPQDTDATPECPMCFCRPCITHEKNIQMWWESIPQPPHNRNNGVRKKLYKRFWTMLFHRQVWQNPQYLIRKDQR